jgi:hypothetical protein
MSALLEVHRPRRPENERPKSTVAGSAIERTTFARRSVPEAIFLSLGSSMNVWMTARRTGESDDACEGSVRTPEPERVRWDREAHLLDD